MMTQQWRCKLTRSLTKLFIHHNNHELKQKLVRVIQTYLFNNTLSSCRSFIYYYNNRYYYGAVVVVIVINIVINLVDKTTTSNSYYHPRYQLATFVLLRKPRQIHFQRLLVATQRLSLIINLVRYIFKPRKIHADHVKYIFMYFTS